MRNKRYFITQKERDNWVHCPKLDMDVQINKTCHKGLGSNPLEVCEFFKMGGHDTNGNYLWCDFGEGDSGQLEFEKAVG